MKKEDIIITSEHNIILKEVIEYIHRKSLYNLQRERDCDILMVHSYMSCDNHVTSHDRRVQFTWLP